MDARTIDVLIGPSLQLSRELSYYRPEGPFRVGSRPIHPARTSSARENSFLALTGRKGLIYIDTSFYSRNYEK